MTLKCFDLTGKVALVTGGSKGLGKAMARGFAEAGADVVISSRHEDELRPALEEILKGTGRRGKYFIADMSKRDDVKRLAKFALDQMGKVDILVNNAGTNIPQAIEHSVDFQAGILRFMQEHGYARVETRPEQVSEWTKIVIKAAEPLLSSKVDSWQTGVNRNVDGRSVRRVLGYNGHGIHFRRKTDEVAKGGYKEFLLR